MLKKIVIFVPDVSFAAGSEYERLVRWYFIWKMLLNETRNREFRIHRYVDWKLSRDCQWRSNIFVFCINMHVLPLLFEWKHQLLFWLFFSLSPLSLVYRFFEKRTNPLIHDSHRSTVVWPFMAIIHLHGNCTSIFSFFNFYLLGYM